MVPSISRRVMPWTRDESTWGRRLWWLPRLPLRVPFRMAYWATLPNQEDSQASALASHRSARPPQHTAPQPHKEGSQCRSRSLRQSKVREAHRPRGQEHSRGLNCSELSRSAQRGHLNSWSRLSLPGTKMQPKILRPIQISTG